jgi:hypothetical protein
MTPHFFALFYGTKYIRKGGKLGIEEAGLSPFLPLFDPFFPYGISFFGFGDTVGAE